MSQKLPPAYEKLPWKSILGKMVFNWRTLAVGFIMGTYLLDLMKTKRYGDPRQRMFFRTLKPTRYAYDD